MSRYTRRFLFLTQDVEFADLPPECRATIIISRVRQSRLIEERVSIALPPPREIPSHFRAIRDSLRVAWTLARHAERAVSPR